ncbi:Phosphotransferase enzyme family protein [Pseudarthrobacter equi]|uniref:Phosphotransferase enzyme family protein n=1 Tax=Pseudarthrobacter equi TaxID=728066 RepID=A0A1H2B551_9MICC|nr:phosphotransferase [Pseudarthrobacter equi]SDT53331.1 Phosphotransferase enzyme family protein [Pseudarthrobacter equi]
MSADEQELTGGNASTGVVRVGDTVRKPWLGTSSAVQGYLATLRSAGVDVPRPLGRDGMGRAVVEFINGQQAMDLLPLGREDLVRVGGMIRKIHDASEAFAIPTPDSWEMLLPAEKPDLMCHNDLAPWNLIMGERWVFIDWDGAGPSTRLWDLAYSAQSFGLLVEGEPVQDAALRLRALVDGYDADASLRAALPAAMARRTAAMHRLLESSHQSGFQPWADMFVNGHGAHWQAAAQYVERNQKAWADALAPGD